MIRRALAALALGLALLAPVDARGVTTPVAAAVRIHEVAQPGSGLPEQAPPPRTLHEFWPVFAVIALVWIGIVGYLLRSGAALGRIARRLD
jgi:CcmD family protein